MIPYKDENATQRTAFVTMGLIAACAAMWIFVQGAGSGYRVAESVCNYGLIPGELTQTLAPGTGFPMGGGLACIIDPGAQYLNVLTSMFLHGSWMHLLGNMWFLWIFGNNIEDAMTRPRFILFYLLCGLVAALLQVFVEPRSGLPMVGASGAISGVMGAYLLLYPKVKVYTMVPLGFFMTTFALPAWVMLIYWMLLQVLGGLGQSSGQGGTAFWAHIGGFVAGLALVKLFVRTDHMDWQRAHRVWRPERTGW